MGLVHKDSQGRQILTANPQAISSTSTGRSGERRVIITTSGGSGEVKQVGQQSYTDVFSSFRLLNSLVLDYSFQFMALDPASFGFAMWAHAQGAANWVARVAALPRS